ncbi:hypothetical protein AWC38_SpisGene23962 [Stylophora pistillata]|uniref:Uncharacterized protein n=1 Tax=Stylophora pistillata TaxID=50429 RepID=A0A2B4R6W1_STYPI|nr:hypothetical protein AWC38_SpisGene23962 [Stylophora pistillata]
MSKLAGLITSITTMSKLAGLITSITTMLKLTSLNEVSTSINEDNVIFEEVKEEVKEEVEEEVEEEDEEREEKDEEKDEWEYNRFDVPNKKIELLIAHKNLLTEFQEKDLFTTLESGSDLKIRPTERQRSNRLFIKLLLSISSSVPFYAVEVTSLKRVSTSINEDNVIFEEQETESKYDIQIEEMKQLLEKREEEKEEEVSDIELHLQYREIHKLIAQKEAMNLFTKKQKKALFTTLLSGDDYFSIYLTQRQCCGGFLRTLSDNVDISFGVSWRHW